ncbi:DUF4202 domain-containing protein [Fluviibacterium sp. DFM31]|uniref:DUF4202 domain-containing protein n=1 Tax=Meridianimarinicoccus marinus TaxID=3231483 RepID=A0ABV3L5E6_9RHOB
MSRLTDVIAAIDAANAEDPNQTDGRPEALVYGERMSAELDRLFPDASEVLQLAARGQHIERWTLKRADYPEGRTGYLTWRRDLAKHHGARVAGMMREAGYSDEEADTAASLLRKEGLKRDPQVQALEDVICFVFLKWYFAPFSAKHPQNKVHNIVVKTARKMSDDGRARVLSEFDLPETLASAFRI